VLVARINVAMTYHCVAVDPALIASDPGAALVHNCFQHMSIFSGTTSLEELARELHSERCAFLSRIPSHSGGGDAGVAPQVESPFASLGVLGSGAWQPYPAVDAGDASYCAAVARSMDGNWSGVQAQLATWKRHVHGRERPPWTPGAPRRLYLSVWLLCVSFASVVACVCIVLPVVRCIHMCRPSCDARRRRRLAHRVWALVISLRRRVVDGDCVCAGVDVGGERVLGPLAV
jgi:hypothetical protein